MPYQARIDDDDIRWFVAMGGGEKDGSGVSRMDWCVYRARAYCVFIEPSWGCPSREIMYDQ